MRRAATWVVLTQLSALVTLELYAQATVDTTAVRPDEASPYQSQTQVSTERSHEENATLADLVNRATGVSIQQSGGGAQPTYVAIRGGNPRQMQVTWNGFKLTPPFGPGFDFALYDPSSFDSVTVIKGGGSTGRGSGALTGAIDLKRGVPPADAARAILGVRLQSFGTWDVLADTRANIDGQWGSLSSTHFRSDGNFPFTDRQGTGQIRLGNDTRRTQAGGAFGGIIDEYWRARGDVLFVSREGGAAGPSEFQLAFEGARSEDQQVTVTAQLIGEKLVGPADWDHHVSLGLGVSFLETSYENPNALIGGGPFFNEADNVGSGMVLRNELYSDSHIVSSVFRGRRDVFSQQGNTEVDAERSALQATIGEEYFVGPLVFAGFLSGGFFTDRDAQWGANLSVVYQPKPWLGVSINGARSFRVPDLDELFLDGEVVRGNPNLDDEVAWGSDLSFSITTDSLLFSVTGFFNRIESTILFLPVSAYLFEAQNVAGFNAFGTETTAGLKLGLFSFRLWHTFTQSEIEGVQSPQQPKHQGGARMVATIPTELPFQEVFSVFAETTARSSSNLDRFGSLKSDGYATVNAGVSAEFFQRLKIAVSGRNLLDDRSREDALQRPLPGRIVSVSASVSVPFDRP